MGTDGDTNCPVCRHAGLAATGQTARLRDVLARWDAIVGPSAAAEYAPDYAAEIDTEMRLMRCGVCGFGCFSPAISGTAAFYSAITENDYYTPDKWEFERAIQDLAALGARRVLDVGCGSGHFLKQLRAACPNVSAAGYDTNAQLIEGLVEVGFEGVVGPVETLLSRAGDLESFDAICLFQVLEHVVDPLVFVSSFAALLRSGGTMIITTPDAAGPIRLLPEALTELPPHHLTQWTEPAFRSMLPRLGLDIILLRHEPLPFYLWDAYLPLVWSDHIWPADLYASQAQYKGLETADARVGYGAAQLRALGFSRLAGVPGHTLYVLAQKRPVQCNRG